MKTAVALVAAVSAAWYAAAAGAPQTSSRKLTIDQLVDIRHPSNPMWSPDGRHVAFVWDRAGVADWYIADVDGRESAPRIEFLQTAKSPKDK